MDGVLGRLGSLVDLGGPVVALLGLVSVLTLAVIFYKLWQFASAGVGRHRVIRQALALWDGGDRARARETLKGSASYLAPVIGRAMESAAAPDPRGRLEAEAEARFARLEGGFRVLESVAQLAPLLGLFGTVLGMIDAFRALQEAGSAVDPSLLAGGIWVALLTTAAGLAVAMPTALVLSWFDGRMARERVFADLALGTILTPQGRAQDAA